MTNNDRVVLVTGALGGIGSAIVARYLKEGMKVGLVDFDAEAGEQRVNALRKDYRNVFFACADVSDFKQCELACQQIETALGPIDTLILNAGISPKKDGKKAPIFEMSEEEWRLVVGVNLNGAFNFCRIVSPGMVQRRQGRIVMMSSVAGKAYLGLFGSGTLKRYERCADRIYTSSGWRIRTVRDYGQRTCAGPYRYAPPQNCFHRTQ